MHFIVKIVFPVSVHVVTITKYLLFSRSSSLNECCVHSVHVHHLSQLSVSDTYFVACLSLCLCRFNRRNICNGNCNMYSCFAYWYFQRRQSDVYFFIPVPLFVYIPIQPHFLSVHRLMCSPYNRYTSALTTVTRCLYIFGYISNINESVESKLHVSRK